MTRTMRRLCAGLLLSAALVLSACAGMGGGFQAPRISLVGASMVSADIFSQQFRVRLHVENPNARPLPIKSIEYKLFLEGDSFADGESLAAFEVPANGEKEFDMTVQTHFMSSIGRLLSRLSGGTSIHYEFAGRVTVAATFSPKIPFRESGVVDLGRRQ